MLLYFTNNSKQKKKLIESDYAEDIYDTILSFFEEHRKFPHFLHVEQEDNKTRISFGSVSEFFYVEGVSKMDYKELHELFQEHDIL